jgi:hypothetical protein
MLNQFFTSKFGNLVRFPSADSNGLKIEFWQVGPGPENGRNSSAQNGVTRPLAVAGARVRDREGLSLQTAILRPTGGA